MTVLQHNPFLIASGNPTDPTFPLQRSVRLRSSASAYFNRTLTTPTNNLKWTWSGWVKRGGLGAYQTLFCGDDGSSNNFLIFRFGSADTLECFQIASGTYNLQVATAAVWRDPSAWYHIVVVYDSANATSTDRIQIYVNNVRQTLSYAVGPFAVNTVSQANVASRNHAIGRILYSSLHYLDGYLTEVNFVDGQALKPIAFGGYNPGTGVWEPRKYSGAYGTNGFYLPFTDNTSTTHLGLSTATSPETNTFWTVVGSAALNTTTKKFGAGSVYFPGSTSRLDGSTTLLSDLNGVDWTIEGWINPTTLAATYIDIFGSNSAGQVSSVSIRTGSSTGYKLNMGDWGTTAFSNITSVTTLTTNTWTHFAITKSGTTLRMFINGTLEATVTSANTTFPSFTCSLGNRGNGDLPYNGYIDDLRITKGIARYTSSFTAPTTAYTLTGETHPVTMLMDFDSSITVGQRMKIWNPSGISLTSGATYDSMVDVPTLTSATNSSYCVLNPLSTNVTGIVPQQGNLYLGSSATYNYSIVGTIGVSSGKWYWECRTDSGFSMVGITSLSSLPLQIAPHQSGSLAKIIYAAAANKYDNGTSSAYGATWTSADLIGIALDMDAGTLTFYKNGTSLGVAFTGLTGVYYPVFGGPNSYNHGWINFGQRPFEQTVPTGHKSLNLFNLSDPAIKQPVSVHNLYTYTGNGGGLQVGEIQKPMSLFNLDRSIRIRAAVNAYFSRLPTVNGNGQKFTISTWIKRGKLGTGWTDTIFTGRTGTNFPELDIMFSTDLIKLQAYTTGAALLMNVDTVNLYRDTNIWYHVVTAFDTTQAVAADRVKVYVNGVTQTIAAGATYPSQNLVLNANQTVTQYIGSSPANTAWGDLYFADYYMIDGQQLTPDSFGQYDGNYYWTPKAYTGTYGTNGFHLEFEDFSAATAAAIGKDTSGQSNNWTPTGINLTTPEVDNEYWDSYTDVPTLKDADTCNYCTLDPLQASSSGLRNGNLTAVWTTASSAFKQRGTYALKTGKWYFEGNLEAFVIGNAGNTNYAIGFITTSGVDTHVSFGWTTNGTSMKLGYRYDVAGAVVQNVTYNTVTPVSTDIFGIEYDVDNGTANFYKNGTLMGSASGLALGEVNPHIWRSGTSNSATMHVNFGQRAFKYTPSAGYNKINAFNVAEVLGDVESPDFVWIKSRSAATTHALFNSVTGVGKYVSSYTTAIEATDVNSLIQFNKNGFLIGNAAVVNTLSATYVAAAWKMAATTTTNNAGTVTSQVRANPNAGISVVTFTTPASGNFTLGHGLGAIPAIVILKNRVGVDSMYMYNKNLSTPATNYLALNTTAIQLSSASIWGSTNPTSSVVTLGTGGGIAANANGLLYCFTEINGFSKFGSYLSNNAADGPFVFCGFRPRWLMVKRAIAIAGATGGWFMYDAARNTYNVMDKYLFAEGTAAENTLGVVDFTANGFKIRSNNVHINTTAGDTYIFLAFAENPFKYALAR